MRNWRHLTIVGGILAVVWTAGCGTSGSSGGLEPDPSEGPMPAFDLPDTNPDSPRYEQLVSPRDFTGAVSAWYFGHAT